MPEAGRARLGRRLEHSGHTMMADAEGGVDESQLATAHRRAGSLSTSAPVAH
jgi:hypothetical protein